MFSAKYAFFALFCNVDPLFSSLYELFRKNTRGGGSIASKMLYAQKDENII
jgi:hypothetical protein